MIDVSGTIAGLDLMAKLVDRAVEQTVADGLHLIQADAMQKAPVGTPGNTTNAPGDLARSIDVEGPTGGDGIYAGRVGPTIIYGRLREMGGDVFAKMTFAWGKHPYGRWGTLEQNAEGKVTIFHFHQEAQPYLKPATDESLPGIEAIAYGHVAVAVGV